MNLINILFIFFGFCCVENGYAAVYGECSTTVSASLPDRKSGCCGVNPPESKLLNGIPKEASIDQYPWIALIEYIRTEINKLETLCGGALISSQYVLTAAHCFIGPAIGNIKPVSIRLGEYDKANDGPDCRPLTEDGGDCTEGAISIPIKQTIIHPEYNLTRRTRRNDIALIRMMKPAPYTDFIHPICLPTTDVTVQKEQVQFTLAGWGTSYGPSNLKQHVDLPFVSQEVCQQVYSAKNLTLWKGHICAGGQKGKDSCKGDAGMPLMYKNNGLFEVIGIVSFGFTPCGQENNPSVYTNVYEYKSWIISNIVP